MDKAEEKLKYPQMIDRVNYLLSELPLQQTRRGLSPDKKYIYIYSLVTCHAAYPDLQTVYKILLTPTCVLFF